MYVILYEILYEILIARISSTVIMRHPSWNWTDLFKNIKSVQDNTSTDMPSITAALTINTRSFWEAQCHIDLHITSRNLTMLKTVVFATPRTAVCQASLSFTIFQSLLKLMSIESVMPSNHLILCHPLFLLPSIFPSIRVFSRESALHIRWRKHWSFSFSISPSNEYLWLIFSRKDIKSVYVLISRTYKYDMFVVKWNHNKRDQIKMEID